MKIYQIPNHIFQMKSSILMVKTIDKIVLVESPEGTDEKDSSPNMSALK